MKILENGQEIWICDICGNATTTAATASNNGWAIHIACDKPTRHICPSCTRHIFINPAYHLGWNA